MAHRRGLDILRSQRRKISSPMSYVAWLGIFVKTSTGAASLISAALHTCGNKYSYNNIITLTFPTIRIYRVTIM